MNNQSKMAGRGAINTNLRIYRVLFLLRRSIGLKVFIGFFFLVVATTFGRLGLLSGHVPGAFSESPGMPGWVQLSHGHRSACWTYRWQE